MSKSRSVASSLLFTVFTGCIFSVVVVQGQTGILSQGFNFFTQGSGGVQYLLYTDPNNLENCSVIDRGNEQSLLNSKYNASKPLKLLIHGAVSNSKTKDDVKLIKDAYLTTKTDANIIMVDYGPLARSAFPAILPRFSIIQSVTALKRTGRIAREISEFVLFLMKSKVLTSEQVHLIGFGLGAHVAGTVGRNVRRMTRKSLNRISGLDPSLQYPFPQISLDRTDASFVDVTNTGIGSWSLRRRGHAQFFVNGGRFFQPNCARFPFFKTSLDCSHHAAVLFYAKSIEKPETYCGCRCLRPFCGSRFFNSRMCIDPVPYGEIAVNSTRGNYYVTLQSS